MVAIGVRTEAYGEAPAALAMYGPEKSADPFVVASPALLDGDPPAVGKDESGHVDGVGKGMLAEPGPGPAVDSAAGIGAKALDPAHRRAEPALGLGLNVLANPARELAGERTSHRAEVGHRSADLKQLDGADRRAAAAEAAVLERPEADALASELGPAFADRPVAGVGALGTGGFHGPLAAAAARSQRQTAHQKDNPPHNARESQPPALVKVDMILSRAAKAEEPQIAALRQ